MCKSKEHTAFIPRKSDYVCSQCKSKRNKANKKARSGTQALKTKLLVIRGNACEICSIPSKNLIIHHKTPVSQGGKTTDENTQLVCNSCHQELHKKSASLAWKGHTIMSK